MRSLLSLRATSDFCCSFEMLRLERLSLSLLLVLRSFKTREIYSRRFVLSGIGGVKLVLSLNGCLCSFWVSLKKYLRYMLRLYCRKDV